jgi:hypothetical protein
MPTGKFIFCLFYIMQTSDYITRRKQTTFFCSIKQDAQTGKGNQHQLQICLPPRNTINGKGVVLNAQSYALLHDFRRGKWLLDVTQLPCTKCAF